jgi:uncharacterized sulfatase
MPNVVLILTDTTNRHHLGAYGCAAADTPNIDRLGREGLRFDNSYSSSPVCTPARGCIFTGLHAPTNGATFNDATPYRNVPVLGELLGRTDVPFGYAGKWHLDGGLYNGYGLADGGFPQQWWYDGKNYADEIGPEMAARRKQFARVDFQQMRQLAFEEEDCWAHRVTDRAISFLQARSGDRPFFFCASYDEPHGPFMCPRRFLDAVDPAGLEIRPNVNADLSGKPAFRSMIAAGHTNREHELRAFWRYYAACNTYLDYEIGRLVEAIDRTHGEDTVVLYTSDHGEQMGSHGCWGKGWAPYEESTATPLIARGPGVAKASATDALASQVDFLPTICDLLGLESIPERTHGVSLRPVLEDPSASVRDTAIFTFDRFGNDGEPKRYPDRDGSKLHEPSKGEFYPMRGIWDGRYKLIVNLFETDELYDLKEDPFEMNNRIGDSALAQTAERLHEALLTEMVQTGDPLRAVRWYDRPWRKGSSPQGE